MKIPPLVGMTGRKSCNASMAKRQKYNWKGKQTIKVYTQERLAECRPEAIRIA